MPGRSLTAKELKDLGVDELVSIADSLRELGDGDLSIDDVFAIIDLALGIDADTFQSVRRIVSSRIATNRVATQADVRRHFQQNRQFWSSEPVTFNGNRVYQRNDLFDPNHTSSWTQNGQAVSGTNLERMTAGRAPIGTDGKPIPLHHMTQSQNGALAEVTQTFHTQNYGPIHINTGQLPSGISRSQFNRWREQYWVNRAASYGD